MTMLTHTRGPFDAAPHPSGARDTFSTEAAAAHLATIKRFCVCAVMALAAGGAVTAVIGLRTATYFWRFHF
jgi:hypothetical protein